jgi:hypothetical protein
MMSTKVIAATNKSTLSWSSSEGPTKREQIVYWTSTGIIAGIMLGSALNFAFNPNMKGAFAHFGLPHWFRIELTTAKLLGVFALLTPRLPVLIKDFAYFGFAITLVSASVAHLSSGDPIWLPIAHSMFLISLAVSYLYYHKRLAKSESPFLKR